MIVREAETWLGVPFKHQGRSRAGVDCAGLILCVGEALGLLDPASLPGSTKRYPAVPNPRHIGPILDAIFDEADETEPGSVVWFGHRVGATHLGIYAGSGKVIHADGLIGRVVRSTLAESVRGVYRYRVARG